MYFGLGRKLEWPAPLLTIQTTVTSNIVSSVVTLKANMIGYSLLFAIHPNTTRSQSKVPCSYLEYKQVTGSTTWATNRHIRSLLFDIAAISVEALITAVDQEIKALVVKWWVVTWAARDLECCHRERCRCTIMHGRTLLAPQWTSLTGTGRFFPILHIALNWHHRPSTFSPNWEEPSKSALPNLRRRSRGG
jgi:hypothetical protein